MAHSQALVVAGSHRLLDLGDRRRGRCGWSAGWLWLREAGGRPQSDRCCGRKGAAPALLLRVASPRASLCWAEMRCRAEPGRGQPAVCGMARAGGWGRGLSATLPPRPPAPPGPGFLCGLLLLSVSSKSPSTSLPWLFPHCGRRIFLSCNFHFYQVRIINILFMGLF